MTMFTIEKKIPIPCITRKGAGKTLMYPWLEMDVGDSFCIPIVRPRNADSIQASVYASAHGPAFIGKPKGFRISTRRLVEDGQHVVRVWRVS